MDQYDEAVSYLTEHPEEINRAWYFPREHPAGCLFRYVYPPGTKGHRYDGVGCITQIRSGMAQAFGRPDITELILNWPGLPVYGSDIGPEHLAAFAELWRQIDAIYEQGGY